MRAGDRLLLVACGALVLAGPIMAIQELIHWRQAIDVAAQLGTDAAPMGARDVAFREVWGMVVLVLVLAVGVLGTVQLARIARSAKVRPLAGRLLALLVLGMVLLDLAFLLDRATASAGYLARALSIVWLYPATATVVALSAARLGELEDAFAGDGTRAAA